MLAKLLNYIRERELIRAGDRVAVAVSGGADSVALLRALAESRSELGFVLAVVHLHHGIRAEADDDAAFVSELAEQLGVECHTRRADVPAFSREHGIGLEAAGRKLRYDFFDELIGSGKLDKIATAHTFDDQAETVLLRMLRGAGTRGLAGIHPRLRSGRGEIIRPLLATSRCEVEQYLRALGQAWREDATNQDRHFLRNRVRHELLPLLERDYNPAIRRVLNETSEIARAEEEFWTAEVARSAPGVVDLGAGCATIAVDELRPMPIASQRRIVRHAAQHAGVTLDFHHVENVLALVTNSSTMTELPNGYFAARHGTNLVIALAADESSTVIDYEYELSWPGELRIPQAGVHLRASVVDISGDEVGYNPASLLDPDLIAPVLVVRNWRAGDRFQALRSRAPEKLKRLLLEKKIVQPQKAAWPVALSGEQIVWVRGFAVSTHHAFRQKRGRAVLIEEVPE